MTRPAPTEPSPSFPAPRDLRIDGLRGIAVLLVLLLHFNLSYALKDSPLGAWLSKPWRTALFWSGNYGVTMFFVISGFLITRHSLLRWQTLDRIDAWRFYALRAVRILPPLVLVLAVILALGLSGHPSFSNADDGKDFPNSFFIPAIGSVLSFWHNLLMQRVGYFNYALNIYWSLSVEEVFYLGFPIACLALKRTRWIVLCALGLIAVAPFYRAAHAGDELYYMYGHLACFDAIAMGVLVALSTSHVPASKALRWLLGVAGAAWVLATFLRGIPTHEALGFSQVGLGTALLLFVWSRAPSPPHRAAGDQGAAHAPWRSWPARTCRVIARPVAWMGLHSYELYLFHIVVLGLMREWVPRDQVTPAAKLLWLAVFLAASAVTAALVARAISAPARRLLRQRGKGPLNQAATRSAQGETSSPRA